MTGLPPGAFIWTNFPFGRPAAMRALPGPAPHIAYHLGTEAGLTLLAYTSSGPWRGATPRVPIGVVEFTAEAAAILNQKAFHLDLRVLARVALTAAWFPRLAHSDRGIVARADAATQQRILQAAKMLASHAKTIEIRGIGASPMPLRRRP